MTQFQPLNDQQWAQLEPLFPEPAKRGRGKPHASWRTVVNAILLVLISGEKWGAIPVSPEYSTKSVAHRWFAIWDKDGFLETLLKAYRDAVRQQVAITVPPRRKREKKVKHTTLDREVASEESFDEEFIPQEDELAPAVHI